MCPQCRTPLLPGQSFCSIACVKAAFPGWRSFLFRSSWCGKGKDGIAFYASPRHESESAQEPEAP